MRHEDLTSNEYYGGLNRRFNKRAARLRKLGFEYEATKYNGAFFTRKRMGRMASIPAATLHHADNRAWFDKLSWALGWFGGTPYRES